MTIPQEQPVPTCINNEMACIYVHGCMYKWCKQQCRRRLPSFRKVRTTVKRHKIKGKKEKEKPTTE